MAKIMAFNQAADYSDTPISYPTSYWKVSEIVIDSTNKIAHVRFDGYLDKDCRLALKQPIAVHRYTVTGADFDTWFSATGMAGKNLYQRAYEMADVTYDKQAVYPTEPFWVRPPENDTTPAPVLFFAGATDDLSEGEQA